MFDLKIELSAEEVEGLRDAFIQYSDPETEKVDFIQLAAKMGSIPGSDPLVGEMMRRAKGECSQRHLLDQNTNLVTFSEFLDLLKNAMNSRQTKKDLRLLFDIFDKDKSGQISS